MWRDRKHKQKQYREYVVERDLGQPCAWCGQIITAEQHASGQTDFDHWIPKSKGGYNTISNLRLMHTWCNNEKADKMP